MAKCSVAGCNRVGPHYHNSESPSLKRRLGRYHWGAVWIHSHVAYEGDDCLFWPFARTRGYGTINFDGKSYAAHQIMCELKRGYKPTPEHEAAHSCGNGKQGCCNPNHLFWRTTEENKQELVLHNEIRKSKLSNKQLSKKYGLSESLIAAIRRDCLK